MYQIVSALNGIMRDELLPNPFEFISNNSIIVLVFTALIGSRILHNLAYSMCGIFYNKGKAPTLGSILYMLFWYLNVGILIKLSTIFNSVLVICILYFAFVIMIYAILNKIKTIIFVT